MPENTPLIRLNDISFGYPGRPLVLDHLNLTLNRGDRIGLVGPNGSGKTSLFHIIMGLLKPRSGKIELFGKTPESDRDFRKIYPRIGLLFQDSDDQLFSPTVLEDVAFGPLNLGKSRAEAVEIARRTLEQLGLSGFEDRITCKLSGGEKRMVALATVLAMEPEILLLDEPSTGLDSATRNRLVDVLNSIGLSFILISHESEFAAKVTNAMYRTDMDMRSYVHAHPHPGHAHA